MDERQNFFTTYKVPDPVRIEKAARFVRGYFRSLSEISILECGICSGGLADMLNKEGADCYGIDINPRDIPGIKIYQADLNRGFPAFNRSFDIIFAGEIMEHLFDDRKFIRSCNKLLKPGGLLIVTVPNLGFIVNRLLILFGKMPMFSYAPFHYHIYTKRTLQGLLGGEGFRILKLSSSHLLFSTRRNKSGRIFEVLGDLFPSLGAHLIAYAQKVEQGPA